MPKFDKVKLKDYIFAKFSYNKGDFADKKNSDNLSIFKGGYTNLTQDQNDPYKNLFKDKSSLILWVGPFTRVKFYENADYTGLNSMYDNLTNNKIKIISCSDFNKKDIAIKNFKSFYVSMIGDLDREIEAFHNQKKSKSKCMSIEKFLLIIILFIMD